MTDLALADFADVVNRVPQPQYLIEYGDLLTSLGRSADAAKEYTLFRAEDQLFVANGVTLDTDATLFEANHGMRRRPSRSARTGSLRGRSWR